jgi:hypothetical protein
MRETNERENPAGAGGSNAGETAQRTLCCMSLIPVQRKSSVKPEFLKNVKDKFCILVCMIQKL